MDWLDEALRHGSGHHGLRRRSCGVIGETFEVLDGGGEQELISGAGDQRELVCRGYRKGVRVPELERRARQRFRLEPAVRRLGASFHPAHGGGAGLHVDLSGSKRRGPLGPCRDFQFYFQDWKQELGRRGRLNPACRLA